MAGVEKGLVFVFIISYWCIEASEKVPWLELKVVNATGDPPPVTSIILMSLMLVVQPSCTIGPGNWHCSPMVIALAVLFETIKWVTVDGIEVPDIGEEALAVPPTDEDLTVVVELLDDEPAPEELGFEDSGAFVPAPPPPPPPDDESFLKSVVASELLEDEPVL